MQKSSQQVIQPYKLVFNLLLDFILFYSKYCEISLKSTSIFHKNDNFSHVCLQYLLMIDMKEYSQVNGFIGIQNYGSLTDGVYSHLHLTVALPQMQWGYLMRSDHRRASSFSETCWVCPNRTTSSAWRRTFLPFCWGRIAHRCPPSLFHYCIKVLLDLCTFHQELPSILICW